MTGSKSNIGDLIPPELLPAIEFDKSYFGVPLKECGEDLVDFYDLAINSGVRVDFNRDLTATGQVRLFLIRKGLVDPLLTVINDLSTYALTLRIEYLYRRLEDQRAAYERSVRTFTSKYPEMSREDVEKIAGVFVAATPATAGHLSGAAIDVTLLDGEMNQVDLGVPYIHPGPESATHHEGISEQAKANRQLLLSVMEKHGFANYPYEYWHFSMGDKIAARVKGDEYAVYGPVIYDADSGLSQTVENPEIPFNTDHLFAIGNKKGSHVH